MDTLLPLVVLILIAIGPAYYVLVPFVSEEVAAVGEEAATRTTELELRKVNLYRQIREVEFEREMGLIDEEDFDRTRADLLAEVAQVMRQLEGAPGDQRPLEAPVLAAAEELVCPGCSTPVQSNDRFCASCGRGLPN